MAFAHPGAPQHHYCLYVPPRANADTPMPLVLMLHGCTQNPLDFATGTGMNEAAASARALVLYPAQPSQANPKGCWNWFRPTDQQRDTGEPAVLMGMVRDVMALHPVDPRRVYVAGLSAGGAMAALLGREYPDVFAAEGVHSGLQAEAAHNVMGALSAMRNGAKPSPAAYAGARQSNTPALPPRPIIVFHGDADSTVHARNGEQLIGDARHAQQQKQTDLSPGGKGYTRTVYYSTADTAGPSAHPSAKTAVAEHWVLHDAGHAWPVATRTGLTPIRAASTPRRRCCAFSWSTRNRRGGNGDNVGDAASNRPPSCPDCSLAAIHFVMTGKLRV